MRIPCPYCGERDAQEFVTTGEAGAARPDAAQPDAAAAFLDHVYLRDNPAGLHREYWYHAAGCHSWLVVTRDTRSHAIADVAYAAGRARPGRG